MDIKKNGTQASNRGPFYWFTGHGRVDPLFEAPEPARVRGRAVAFEPSARAVAMPPAKGAVHSADIEYALGNLATNLVYAWTEDDKQVSKLMQSYYANFVKNGDPNGPNLPEWPSANEGSEMQTMVWDVEPHVLVNKHRARYELLERLGSE